MDIEALVKEIHAFFMENQRERGPYWLVMLVGSTAFSASSLTKWNLVVSAPWIDEVGDRAALSELIRGLKSTLSPGAWSEIGRFSVVRTKDPFLQGMRSALWLMGKRTHTEDGSDYPVLQDTTIEGYEVPLGIVILSSIPAPPKPSPAAPHREPAR